jgi:tetratricopeptide (TPR) repeat protein
VADRQPRQQSNGASRRSSERNSTGNQSKGAQSRGAQSKNAQSRGAQSRGKGGRGEPARRDGRSGAGQGFSRPRRDERPADARPRSEDQQRYDGPPIPEEITGKELDRSIAAQLRSLPEKLGQRVARHLVAAGELIESDPRLAYQHTLAARARASRLAVVREAVGEAAYAAGEYAEALSELRAAKRMNGAHDYVAIMADCERALKRPDRALALVRNAPREALAPALNAELTIVEAGARRDRGELEAALRTLENAPINSRSRAPWVARLRYAYADTLVQAERPADALEWFHRTEAVDPGQATDAARRAAELERQLG